MTKFDPTKPVKTRDGREARIICTDRVGDNNIIALVKDEDGGEYAISCNETGKRWLSDECKEDLVNILEKKTGYIAIIKGGDVCTFYGKPFQSKEDLFLYLNKDKILKVIKVGWEE